LATIQLTGVIAICWDCEVIGSFFLFVPILFRSRGNGMHIVFDSAHYFIILSSNIVKSNEGIFRKHKAKG